MVMPLGKGVSLGRVREEMMSNARALFCAAPSVRVICSCSGPGLREGRHGGRTVDRGRSDPWYHHHHHHRQTTNGFVIGLLT